MMESTQRAAGTRSAWADRVVPTGPALVVLHVLQPSNGGVPDVAADLARDQASVGFDVHVACADDCWDRYYGCHDTGSLVITFHRWSAHRAPGRSVLREWRVLRDIVAAVGPDIVHLHSAKAGLVGRIIPLRGASVIFQPHAWSFQARDSRLWRLARIWEFVASQLRTSAIVCVSPNEYRLAERLGISSAKLSLIPNGVNRDYFAPREAQDSRERLGVLEDKVVLCIGRVAYQKGQDILVGLWPQVRAVHDDAVLIIVGSGSSDDGFSSSISELCDLDPSIMLVNEVKDTRDYYAAAAVVVVPSRWEGMALVPIEALAMGRLVVGFRVGGTEGLESSALLAEPGNAQELSALINDALDAHTADPPGKGRDRQLPDEFDRRRAAAAVRDLYRATLFGRRGHSEHRK